MFEVLPFGNIPAVLDGLDNVSSGILHGVGVYLEMPETPVRQSDYFFAHLRFAAPEDLLDMALLANGAAALKHLVTMSADQLFGFAMIDAHQGLVAHHDPEVSVVDDQGVGDAVQDPVQELFTRRDRIHFQFHENLVTSRHVNR